MWHSSVGTIRSVDGKDFIHTEKGQSGFALFGPYRTFGPGNYVVTFNFWKPNTTFGDYDVLAVADVTADNGNICLTKSPVVASRLNDSGCTPVELKFSIDSHLELEFRVWVTGAMPVNIECDRVVTGTSVSQNRFASILVGDADIEHDEFFEKNFEAFRGLFERGADVLPSKNGTIVKFFGTRFYVKNQEDFQLIHEIFINNSYNFQLQSDVIVMDIGMNVGLASLYFAKMSSVKAVYSFEPFQTPFERASENFRLNPDFSAKIKPYRFGLAGKTETISVRYNESNTISASIKGRSEGAVQTIAIQEAAKVFSDVIREAQSRQLGVIVKMDCEGSEFPIFKSLEAHNLIGQIRIFMIEWHKWWSADKTQFDLIEPLSKCGFDVLDHTNPFDPWAGMLYAIKAAR